MPRNRPTTEVLLYFAYGANMSRAQMAKRVGHAVPAGERALLRGYTLAFSKRAFDGTGRATIVPAKTGEVWGVLFPVTDEDVRVLDAYEGVPEHYRRTQVTVEDANGAKRKAWVYIAEARYLAKNLTPAPDYFELILEGAREHGLPDDYVGELETGAGTEKK